ncbi:hypothetical protein CASFOL_022550 [Castilleja foliolosa]|uniref:Uncharacterized protein n=1 Tax=Castilleja foliolosa TaxID=1961234 RepID=A0ABD3CUU8_9LAMI
MDGYLDNQLMLFGWLNHGMEIPVADVDGPLLYLKLQTNSIFGGLLCHRLFKNSLIESNIFDAFTSKCQSKAQYSPAQKNQGRIVGKQV